MRARGKKLSDSGAKTRLYHAVKEAHLAHFLRIDLKSELFAYDIASEENVPPGMTTSVLNCLGLTIYDARVRKPWGITHPKWV